MDVMKVGLDWAAQMARFTIERDGTPLAAMAMELPELSGFIAELAHLRADFSEQVPAERDDIARVAALPDPQWHVTTEAPGLPPGMVLLQLRHPGYGWLHFLLPRDGAKQMGRYLAE